MVQGWKRIPIFLCVESIRVFATSNNIFGLMVKGVVTCSVVYRHDKGLFKFGGLGLEELARKLVSMGCNGSSIFQGHQTNVTMQFNEVVAPFLSGIHYFAHKMNFVMITLFDLPLVHRLEGVLQSLYFILLIAQRNSFNFKSWQI
jgi:hypothetical protein